MKFILFIPLILIVALQSVHMGVDDALKIPELVEHYQEHRNDYGDDFLSFLNKHYGSEKEKHASHENEEHQDLPFNHSHHVCIDMKVDIPSMDIEYTFQTIVTNDYFVYHAPYTKTYTYSILQPPIHNC